METVLMTRRLLLRTAREADIPSLHQRIFGVPEVMRYVFAGGELSAYESEIFIKANFNFGNETSGLSVLTERGSDRIVGVAGLLPCDTLGADDLELGFILAKEVWGRGFGREIGQGQLDLGFRKMGRNRLLALVHPDNAPSRRVLEKLGMVHVKDLTTRDRGVRQVYLADTSEWAGRKLDNG
jgi:RimJ/RimL family protein N-acetyltransferase